ncbi:rhomboid-like protein [Streptomyces sp. V4I2]|uniref:rhomboid-like protein n=1 Tax=Streptomyces sp. V4I2 TaxID=3042280 RepID=UPI0027D8B205|nr:rhomboid-like protein [Streptomyces sp. V4I2]
MERTETDGTAGSPAPAPSDSSVPQDVPPPRYDACLQDVSGLLDGMPRQREAPATMPVGPPVAPLAVEPPEARPGPRPRPWRLLPTPTGTPFTFGYGVVLAVTSLVTEYADPAVVHDLHQASSTDVAHLVQTPALVLLTSALWIAGGILSPFAIGFLLVLTALERRIGGLRTAGVFLLGHVLATLATEVPIGLAVLIGHLPDSSLHRLDYGVSFGVAAGVGALAGLLTPWLRWPLLAVFGAMLLRSLLAFTDPMTDWGHLTAFAIGIGTWPVVRGWYRARLAAGPLPGVA